VPSFRFLFALTLAAASAALAPNVARATVYYVSPHGHDSSSGTSRRDAWQTVARVNAAQLRPGDKVRFETAPALRQLAGEALRAPVERELRIAPWRNNLALFIRPSPGPDAARGPATGRRRVR